jgi:hypothetical protein
MDFEHVLFVVNELKRNKWAMKTAVVATTRNADRQTGVTILPRGRERES